MLLSLSHPAVAIVHYMPSYPIEIPTLTRRLGPGSLLEIL